MSCKNPCDISQKVAGLTATARVMIIDAANCAIRYATIGDLIAYEVALLTAYDTAIKAGAGLETDGSYIPDETTNYLKAADFSGAGYTASLKAADKLLDAQIASLTSGASAPGMLPPVIDTADITAAPPTQVADDMYLLLPGTQISIGQIEWRGANTVRLHFTGSPDMTGWTINNYIQTVATANAETTGTFIIVGVNIPGYTVDVTMPLVTDASYDEGPGLTTVYAYFINQSWGSVAINDHVTYTTSWVATTPVEGTTCIVNASQQNIYTYTGSAWRQTVGNSLYASYVTMTQSEVNALNGTPIDLIAAPGVGKTILPVSVIANYKFHSAAFATNTNVRILYDTANIPFANDDKIILGTVDRTCYLKLDNDLSGGVTDKMIIENKKVYVDVETGNPTGGGANSLLTIGIIYQIAGTWLV